MAEHYCREHQTDFFKRGNMRGYAHPIGEKDESTGKYPRGWCNEEDAETYHSPQGDEPLVAEAKKMGAKVTGVDNLKNRSMSVAYSKDLVCAGKIDLKQLSEYADKFLKYIENK